MKGTKWWKRALAAVLCVAMTAAVTLVVQPKAQAAYASLPHIEEIVGSLRSGGSSFRILEIADETGGVNASGGEIGYYIAGQEPTADWKLRLAAGASRDKRQAYMTALKAALTAKGLLGTSAAAPLTWTDYTEKYVWEAHDGMTVMTLGSEETAAVQGTYLRGDAGSGPYRSDWTYNRSNGGGYVQKIDYFVAAAAGGTGAYYYVPTFAALNDPTGGTMPTPADGTQVYTQDAGGYYVYAGTAGQGLELDQDTQYYSMTATGEPVEAGTAGAYAAVSDSFTAVAAGAGYFSRDLRGYTYVGGTLGDTTFTPGAGDGTETKNITYKTVYYSGGYVNNGWFLKKVFDRADADLTGLSFRVTVVAPSAVTSDEIKNTDMIVLHNASGSLSPDRALEIYNACSLDNKLPLVLDYAATGASDSVLQTLARLIVRKSADGTYSASGATSFGGLSNGFTWTAPSDADHNFAAGSVYCYTGELAKPGFSAAYADTAGFESLLQEISNENFLRQQQGLTSDQLLPTTVSMASAVRYIINYGGQRTTSAKSAIRVLELQPGRGSELTAATVRSWIGDKTNSVAVTIDTMSTAEFTGKLDSLNEKYDMIYVGTSTTGFNTKTDASGKTITDFNDNTMDGMLYTNVGDTYKSDIRMAGLLKRDYSDSTLSGSDNKKINSSDTSRTFRFSGNDLTKARAQELKAFADTGYPIILADDLMSKQQNYASTTFRVNVARDGMKLTASVEKTSGTGTLPTNAADYHYAWYQSGYWVSADQSYTVTKPGEYQCKVTISGTDIYTSGTATSNVWTAENGVLVMRNTGNNGTSGIISGTSYDATLSVSIAVKNYYGADLTHYYFERGTNTYLSATVKSSSGALPDNVEYQYTWQKSSSDSNWQWVSAGTGSTITYATKKPDINYRCVVTSTNWGGYSVDPSRIISKTAYYTRNGTSCDIYTDSESTISCSKAAAGDVHYNVNVTTVSATTNGITLRADVNPAINVDRLAYYWYEVGYGLIDSSYSNSISFTESYVGATIYCTVVPYYNGSLYWSSRARSSDITISRGALGTPTEGAGTSNGTFTVYTGDTYVANSARVDNSSYMYEALSYAIGKPNVMSAAAAVGGSTTVLRYLNLSRPVISLTGKPTPYQMTDGVPNSLIAGSDGKYYLSYTFTIQNATDATPASTRYDCRLYLDQNADGKYSESERLSDIVIRASGGGLVTSSGGVYSLSAGVTYTLTRQMPTDYAGFLSWELKVVKNGAANIHASEHGYTHITRKDESGNEVRTSLNILQISSSRTDKYGNILNKGINLQKQMTPTSATHTGTDCYSTVTKKSYSGIYGKLLADVPDFNVTITTLAANSAKLTNDNAADAILTYLKSYDMLVIGFDDMYQELGSNAADAIVSYIGTGRSVLFTHDTTSQANVPFSSYMSQSGVKSFDNDLAYWGYYFNKILRPAVNLDRYGIRSSYRDDVWDESYLTSDVMKASGQGEKKIKALQEAGYSIAYAPGSAKKTTVDETQGYTNYALYRYGDRTSNLAAIKEGYLVSTDVDKSQGRETGYVSQLNEGQITTYPYDVNTAAFGGTDSEVTDPGGYYMSVATTHEQYYQINMNSDNIVVWYCLANKDINGYYSNLPNDATNAYYIFSRGNVTYSGAGHTSGDKYLADTKGNVGNQYENEAKLFVNTMIAAYRTANEKPTVSFTETSDGTLKKNYLFLSMDSGSDNTDVVLSSQAADADARTVYFKVTDPNLSTAKKIAASLSYTVDDGTDVTSLPDVPVYLAADPTKAADAANLTGGLVYEFTLPDSVVEAIRSDTSEDAHITLTIQVTTTIEDASYTGTDTLQIRKIGLFKLS